MAKIKHSEKTEKKKKKMSKFKTKHYPCSYCSKTFTEKAGRDHHLQLHSSERPFSCSLCSHTFKTKKYLAKHSRVVHKPPTSFKCEYCDKMFHYKCVLDKHIVVHTNSKPYKCKDCGKGFNSHYSLRTHSLIHKNLKPYTCKFCEYACRDSSTLRKHHERHIGIVRHYECNICDRRFSKKERLQLHVAEDHMKLNLKNIPCGLCDTMFRTKSLRNVHIEIIHNRKYATTCEICGVKLSNKYNMNTHLLSHVDVRPYKCRFSGCDKTYKDPSSLQKHSIIHYPEKHFPCKICGKKFTRRERWRKHKKQHVAKTKNVKCDHCGVCFYNKNYLTVHIRKKHARRKKRKYICDMCDFESGNKPGLIVHIKGHNTKMDKECPMCMKKYKKENSLRLHLWHTHKVMETSRTPIPEIDIKVEPMDIDGTPEFELFEIEKEEILDELNYITKNTNPNEKTVRQSITEACNEFQKESQNFELNIRLENVKYNLINKKPSHAISTENNDFQKIEHGSKSLLDDSNNQNARHNLNEEILSVNENLRIYRSNAAVGHLVGSDNDYSKQNTIQCNDIVVENTNNEKSMQFSIFAQTDNDKSDDSKDVTTEDGNIRQNLDELHSTRILNQDIGVQNKQCSQTIRSLENYKQLYNLKEVQLKIQKVCISKEKSLAEIKASLVNKQKFQKKSKHLGILNKKSNGSKRNSLAQIKAKILHKKRLKNNTRINSENHCEPEEFEQDLEYSKSVLSEDIAHCMAQRKKKKVIKHIVGRHEKQEEKEKNCQSYAKDCVNRLLEKTRKHYEIKLIEKTRQLYNERIRKETKIRPGKITIKYFDRTSANKVDIKTDHQVASQETNSHINDERDIDKRNKQETSSHMSNERNIDKSCETERNYLSYDDKLLNQNSRDTTEQENEMNKIHQRYDIENKKRHTNGQISYNNTIQNVDGTRKIKLNTHQCYVCFKLFKTKEVLLDHCKDHFEVCNTTILKKCPLCDFATNLNITRHMKEEHDVEITIPSTRIIDKETENGPRFCYKVNSTAIEDIDVIPSVKNLNKQAYIDIDKRNRKLKDTGIAKTKLVKKGKEWIVERQTTRIDNVDEFILPEFDVDEIMSIKIDSNDYLSRMKKLYRLAKKYKIHMLFPCENCDKICQTLSALKLHCRRHDPKSKPFKKKVWKHKIKDFIQPTKNKVTDIDYGMKKYTRVVEIDKINVSNDTINDNRYKRPKPVVNKHKCDPELIKFYETNIKGGDIEFWQFLKIFNKMSRENINNFDDLNERPEFGIHTNEKNAENIEVNENEKKENISDGSITNITNIIKIVAKPISKNVTKNKFNRKIRISKRDHDRRNYLKQRLREKIAEEKFSS